MTGRLALSVELWSRGLGVSLRVPLKRLRFIGGIVTGFGMGYGSWRCAINAHFALRCLRQLGGLRSTCSVVAIRGDVTLKKVRKFVLCSRGWIILSASIVGTRCRDTMLCRHTWRDMLCNVLLKWGGGRVRGGGRAEGVTGMG